MSDLRDCKACRERVKNWQGGDPVCAFRNGRFNAENWNCATANLIRDLVYEGESHEAVDYRYCEDQKYATVKIDGNPVVNSLALWVTWYKSRGRTEAMWLLNPYDPPDRPTEDDCLAILAQLKPGTPRGVE